jgi:hypothetical protein
VVFFQKLQERIMSDDYSSIQREREDCNFTVLNNTLIRDKEISPRARWFISYCLSFPESWKISIPFFIKDQNISKDIMYQMIDEAIDKGYMRREEKVISGLKRYRYFVASSPKFKKCLPCPEKPDTGNPDPEKPDTNKELLSSSEELRKKDSKKGSSTPPPADAVDLSEFFLSKIKEKRPDVVLRGTDKWAEAFDKMIRLDNRSVESIKRIITWLVNDKKELSFCMSASKLREKYDSYAMRSEEFIEKQLITTNRELVMHVINKYPDKTKMLKFTDKYVLNVNTQKDLPYDLPPKVFEESLQHLF